MRLDAFLDELLFRQGICAKKIATFAPAQIPSFAAFAARGPVTTGVQKKSRIIFFIASCFVVNAGVIHREIL